MYVKDSQNPFGKVVEAKYEIERCGNWHYKYKDLTPIYTKPIALLKINHIQIALTHEEVIKINNLLVRVDNENIKMIYNNRCNTGIIRKPEVEFIKKLKINVLGAFKPDDWEKVFCPLCGNTHLLCEKCNTYLWVEKDGKFGKIAKKR